MKRCILISSLSLILLLATTIAHAFTPTHFWSQRFGSTGFDMGRSVAVDGLGNVFVTGSFVGTVDFGGGDLVNAGSFDDIFLAKYDANGAHQWSQRFGSTSNDAGTSVAVDGSGNVFVTGRFFGTVDFGGGNLVSAGGADFFLAKYDGNGAHQWSQRFGGTGEENSRIEIALDGSGSVFVTGAFAGTVDFGGGNRVSAGGEDIFLAKYDGDGVHQWSQRFGSTGPDIGYSVAVDGSGVVVTGYFSETANFGGGDLVSAGSVDIFLAKFDANGTHQWSQRFGGASLEVGASAAVDGSGNVFVTGIFGATANFGGGDLVSAGIYDVFLAKYDGNGSHQWSQRFGASGVDQGYSVAVDGTGSVFVTGSFSGTVDFGGGNLVSAVGRDIFLAKYDPNGVHQWSQRSGGTNDDEGTSVAVDGSGDVFVTGYFSGTVDFGGGNLVSAGNLDIFLAKYHGASPQPVIASIDDIGNDQGRRVNMRFARSGEDDASSAFPVLRYVAFRRVDDPPAAATPWRDPVGLSERELLLDGWTQVGSVDAFAEAFYHIDVPTVGDSTQAQGQYYSVFFIRAATNVPSTFYDSPIDSGYSIDNLAPGIPGSLLYTSGTLSWNESTAEDFDYFTVYGASVDEFGSATVVDYTVALSLDVTASPYAFYYVTATDFSGNEGTPVAINTLTGIGGTPRRYVLSVSNYPNPFNPRTTVSYTVPSRGAVSVAIYDARGARVATLVSNEVREAGAHRLDWNGRADSGTLVSSGVYFARIEHAGATRTRKMVLLK